MFRFISSRILPANHRSAARGPFHIELHRGHPEVPNRGEMPPCSDAAQGHYNEGIARPGILIRFIGRIAQLVRVLA